VLQPRRQPSSCLNIFVIETLRCGQWEFTSQKGYFVVALVKGVSPNSSQKEKRFSDQFSQIRFTDFSKNLLKYDYTVYT
jgi:hypothetical protein